jgi:hypothetical protein
MNDKVNLAAEKLGLKSELDTSNALILCEVRSSGGIIKH